MSGDERARKPDLRAILFRGIVDFVRTPSSEGVHHFLLTDSGNVPTQFTDFVALYPLQLRIPDLVVVRPNETPASIAELYSRVLSLEFSDEYINQLHPDIREGNSALEKKKTLSSISAIRPIIVISFGKSVQERKNATVLNSVWGISPVDALKKIQERVKKQLQRLN